MSNPVPDQLALTSIADDAEIIASDHRNNYSAIQTAVNALITALSGGTTGQALLAADSSDVEWGPAAGTYVPTWSASSSNPSLGNGTITGRYIQVGKLVYGTIYLSVGSTTTFGTGSWEFSRPVTAQSVNSGLYLAEVYALDSSAGAEYSGRARTIGTVNFVPVTNASPMVDYSSASPFTWASNDRLAISFLYEAA